MRRRESAITRRHDDAGFWLTRTRLGPNHAALSVQIREHEVRPTSSKAANPNVWPS
jgi:hypothetical protein